MKVKNKNYSSIWEDNGSVNIIDQTKIPFEFNIIKLKTLKDFEKAIKNMKVRGAPLIGVTAAYALSEALKKNSSDQYLKKVYKTLLSTRPTAINLKWALNYSFNKIIKENKENRQNLAHINATKIRNDDIINCQKIAINGLKIIENMYKNKKKAVNILTHCNAGWLATVDWGTALAPIFLANRNKIPIHIWVDETRPRNQGALLTAWELKNEKVPYTIVTDNAAGYLMQKGKVDMCIVGSDRITSNGDVCNKIGTYLKALVAREHNIPFYVAAPISTIDFITDKGELVPIEIRNGKELSRIKIRNRNGYIEGDSFFYGATTFNPAFDFTPYYFINKLITENGVFDCNKETINKLKNNGS